MLSDHLAFRLVQRVAVRLLLLVGLVTLAGAASSASSQGLDQSEGGAWVMLNPLRPLGSYASLTDTVLSDIHCPTEMVCYAIGIGGAIFGTTDGGKLWRPQASGTTDWISSISCPSTKVCYAVTGSLVLATVDGGNTWSPQATGASEPLTDVSCPTETRCTAVTTLGNVVATETGGDTWNIQASPAAGWLEAISCPSSTTCYAVGTHALPVVTTNGGATWNILNLPPTGRGGAFWLNSVSCPDEVTCFLAGTQWPPQGIRILSPPSPVVLATIDGGKTWASSSPATDDFWLTEIDCPESSTCFVLGTGAVAVISIDGGRTWQRHDAPRSLSALSCPTGNVCFAVGGTDRVAQTSDGGARWELQPTAQAIGLFDIDCPTLRNCYAAGDGDSLVATFDGGATWQAQSLALSGAARLSRIRCPSPTTCFVVAEGIRGSIVRTTDGGTNWVSVHSTPAWFQDLSCPTRDVCFAIEGRTSLAVTVDGGETWETRPLAGANLEPDAIDCPAASTCVVVGLRGRTGDRAAGAITTDSGVSWTSSWTAPHSIFLATVSCPSLAVCVAVGHQRDARGEHTKLIVMSQDGGATWARTRPWLGAVGDLGRVNCSDEHTCVAAGLKWTETVGIVSTRNGGRSWAESLSKIPVRAVSCPAVDTCFAVTEDGYILATNHAPALDLNGAFPSTDFETIFTQGGPPVPLLDLGGIADPDPWQLLDSTRITISNPLDAPNERLSVDPAALSGTAIAADFDPTAGVLLLSGVDTIAHYQLVLQTLRYANTAIAPDTLDRAITVVANDAALDSNVATSTVAIRLADPPDVTLLGFTATMSADGQVALAWETAAEPSIAGFHVRRARWIGAAAVRVNPALIPAKGSPTSGARYSLGDQPGVGRFRYWLEGVNASGTGQVIAALETWAGVGRGFLPVAVKGQ